MGLRSVWQRLIGRGDAAELDPDRPDLIVVAASFDDAEAASTALARAELWTPDAPAVLRHHLRLPADRVESAIALAAQEGYSPAATESDGPTVELILRRVQLLDALHCAQERSRMAGLAQRHDGVALGWDALQPEAKEVAPPH
ncbi:ribonuclease E inhibitor RraB [Nocardia sp. CDC159]|uniref:Ribonuclease E inhibitor RraB n=1 Tax=Nocardia pulmonis TaxID=2951408 RepID=A0A9X2IVM5_9NOCA|nr:MULTISPECIES: ribonuclease E inhibitor RraB [Nocardia]MCM6773378.1 ribonuclease E inhibitor RraB [Nocardia pulmonis]MCM6786265.1 ribonuclease E inhibitor RraB [Nocardia sp. CDC159]